MCLRQLPTGQEEWVSFPHGHIHPQNLPQIVFTNFLDIFPLSQIIIHLKTDCTLKCIGEQQNTWTNSCWFIISVKRPDVKLRFLMRVSHGLRLPWWEDCSIAQQTVHLGNITF